MNDLLLNIILDYLKKTRLCTIYLLNIILDYLKKTVRNLFTITTNTVKEVFRERKPLKLLNKIIDKYLRKSSFLVKLQVLKMNSFIRIFKGFC